MIKNAKTLAVVALMMVSTSAFAAKYKVDSSHSQVGFSVKHLVVTNVKGHFAKYEGGFDFDEKKGTVSNIDVKIDAASINTNDEKRDEHLRSPDFFDVAKHKDITFKGKKVEFTGGKPVKVSGDLTIRGVTKPVTLDIDYGGAVTDPWGNEKVGFTLTGKINRKDFGVNWSKNLDKGGAVVADDVKLEIEVEANKVK